VPVTILPRAHFARRPSPSSHRNDWRLSSHGFVVSLGSFSRFVTLIDDGMVVRFFMAGFL